MNKLFIILGLLLMLPSLTVIFITNPMDIENEIDLESDDIALIDIITIYYMLISSLVIGAWLVTTGINDIKGRLKE